MKTILLITCTILSFHCVCAQTIHHQTVVAADIYYRLANVDEYTGAQVYVEGKFDIPTINPAEFEIVDFEVELESIAMGAGWVSRLHGGHTSSISHSMYANGSVLELNYSDTGENNGGGSSSSLHSHASKFGIETFGLNNLYSTVNTPQELHFKLGGSGSGSSGSLGYIYWGYATVSYTLRRIDPNASLPPSTLGVFGANRLLSVQHKDQSNRVHPSLFEDPEFVIPGVRPEVPAQWTFPSPKAVSCEIWGLPGYRYTLMKGSIPGSGNPVASMDGSGTHFTIQHDDSESGDDKAFFWVKEEKIE